MACALHQMQGKKTLTMCMACIIYVLKMHKKLSIYCLKVQNEGTPWLSSGLDCAITAQEPRCDPWLGNYVFTSFVHG